MAKRIDAILSLKDDFSTNLAKAKQGFKHLDEKFEETAKGYWRSGNSMIETGEMLAKSITLPLTGIAVATVKSYADIEQSLGGVETIYGDSADQVIKNAEKAYLTAGVSANDYMEGVVSFGASLMQSTGGNTEEAARIADMAFRDMSDKLIVRVKHIELNQRCAYKKKTSVCANGENLNYLSVA